VKTATGRAKSSRVSAAKKSSGASAANKRTRASAAKKRAAPKAAAKKPARMYRTNLQDVPKVGGLKRKDGWVDMQVQFLIDRKSAGADHVVGWTVLKPGARHENHRHHNCDEFFIVLKGKGHIYTENGEQPSSEGDVVYSPRTCWHGFNNTSNEDVVLVWGWMGAGSIEASGYEVDPETH
jgi:mannose-6-phosphate isomerase-like protein (cupin superfamily)